MNHASIRCPRCHEGLEVVQVSTIGVEGCLGCGGLWIDPEATSQILDFKHSGALLAVEEMGLNARWVIYPQSMISCPECTQPMDRFSIEGANIEIDQCKDHGFWFDCEELLKLARWREQHDGKKILGVSGGAALGAAALSTTASAHHGQAQSSSGHLENAVDAAGVIADIADAVEVGVSVLELVFGLVGSLLD
jgi:Zn-finger nucleic acid-binding protein